MVIGGSGKYAPLSGICNAAWNISEFAILKTLNSIRIFQDVYFCNRSERRSKNGKLSTGHHMPTGYQIKDQSAAYYLTFQVVFWIDLFSYKNYRDIIIDSLKYCQQDKGLEIFAWVIMSNHIHMMARSSEDNLSGTIRDFKKFTSKAIIEMISTSGDSRKDWMLRLFQHAAKRQNKTGNFQVWTHENHAIEVYGNSFIQSKVDYIHNNPIRAGIVGRVEDYKYSSACNYADREGLLKIIPIGSTWRTIK